MAQFLAFYFLEKLKTKNCFHRLIDRYFIDLKEPWKVKAAIKWYNNIKIKVRILTKSNQIKKFPIES